MSCFLGILSVLPFHPHPFDKLRTGLTLPLKGEGTFEIVT